MIAALIPALMSIVTKVVDKAVPDTNAAAKLKAEMSTAMLAEGRAELESAMKIVMAEANGESWLQRNWRPILMLWFAGLVGAHWLGFTPPNLPTDVVNNLLDIVQVGVGGYIVGRSAEKTVKAWKE